MDSSEADVRMAPLEFEDEEEMTSLIIETAGGMASAGMRKRRVHGFGNSPHRKGPTGFRGLLRGKTAYMIRNALMLGVLGWIALMFITAMNSNIERVESDERRSGHHGSSFGGSSNRLNGDGQYDIGLGGGESPEDEESKLHDGGLPIPPDADLVGNGVMSVSTINARNYVGHYWHDPYRSPYSSPFYDGVTRDERIRRQQDFEVMLNATRDRFGGDWGLQDPYVLKYEDKRPTPSYDEYPNGDVPFDQFPSDAWQLDDGYVGDLIKEARSLVHRMKEGIFEEYGYPSKKGDGSTLDKQAFAERSKRFGVLTEGYEVNDDNVAIDPTTKDQLEGVAHMSKTAWDALVKKLLHAMYTNGDFFVVLVGDGRAAGHGNNFVQSSIMQFHYIMEPVLDLLGVRLISRNMAMKDTSVIYQAMGGADIYGETDILWYSSTSETESAGALDLLYKQAILGGERVPIILTNKPGNLAQDSSQTAWIGNLQPGRTICGDKKDGVCDMNTHHSVCWIKRVDVNETVAQENMVLAKDNLGVYKHQLEARKLTMMLLCAIDEALDRWDEGIQSDGIRLIDEYWHINEMDVTVRDAIRTFEGPSDCDKMLGSDLQLLCHVELHAFTEWTPRIRPRELGLRYITHRDMDIQNYLAESLYTDVDLLPLEWKPKDIDLHAVALVTSVPPRESDKFNPDLRLYNSDVLQGDDLGVDGGFDKEIDEYEGSRVLPGTRQELPETRRLDDEEGHADLEAGRGWIVHNPVFGYCDGSAQSTCGRDPQSRCLMAGHNDYRNTGLLGDDLSGWLILSLECVREGMILARFDMSVESNFYTVNWKKVNDVNDDGGGDGSDNNDERRQLTDDFTFEFAINGKPTELSAEEFKDLGVSISNDMVLHPLLRDKELLGGDSPNKCNNVELGIRVTADKQRSVTILLTHIYYA